MVLLASTIEIGDRGEDRITVRYTREGVVIVVADGAGGVGGGAFAAQSVCDILGSASTGIGRTPESWETALYEADRTLSVSAEGGLSTAVVVEVTGDTLFGASVGDVAQRGLILTRDDLRATREAEPGLRKM